MAVRRLVQHYAQDRILLLRDLVTLYEDVADFWVAELLVPDATTGLARPAVVGCGAVHVLWEDLAEVRSVAVDPAHAGQGVGTAVLTQLLATARDLGVSRVFCLTFEVAFFERHGFRTIAEAPVPPEVFVEMVRSHDEGVAEFLDLDRVRPNTLGNTRMLLELEARTPPAG